MDDRKGIFEKVSHECEDIFEEVINDGKDIFEEVRVDYENIHDGKNIFEEVCVVCEDIFKKFLMMVKISLKIFALFFPLLSLFFHFISPYFFISFLLISLDDGDGDISYLQPKASLTFEFI